MFYGPKKITCSLTGIGLLMIGVSFLIANSANSAFAFVQSQQRSSASSGSATKTMKANATSSASQMAASKNSELQPTPFAFIELFTSEGCSSCPSADENLERIASEAAANGTNVYTLSYHVDYWNYLGWDDPYSSKQASDRQRKYARAFDSSRIYTPQMVVNGLVEFVGSNRKTSERALQTALNLKPTVAISGKASIGDKNISVEWNSNGVGSRDIVNIALVQNAGTQKVARGENARRELSHVNIVRQFKAITQPESEGQAQIAMPADFEKDTFHVLVFVQSSSGVQAVTKVNFDMASKMQMNQKIESTMQSRR